MKSGRGVGGEIVAVGGRKAAADVPGRGVLLGAGERAGRSSIPSGSAGSLSRRPGTRAAAGHTLKNDKNHSSH